MREKLVVIFKQLNFTSFSLIYQTKRLFQFPMGEKEPYEGITITNIVSLAEGEDTSDVAAKFKEIDIRQRSYIKTRYFSSGFCYMSGRCNCIT